ncbi:hypothetical protein EKO04_002224 [Ascochyta lentis]|uniref:DUF7587 domain-containing protein n=1 Tax=Ascochyta lentis TaxID=205686 RepID=A0A8H7J9Z7_9PLEO|nr:hypothetical protein EKO04_002224 [Ascochyta lentis]
MDSSFQPTLYNPRGKLKKLVEHLDRIPCYLFRTQAPRTNGTTTVTLVQSAAATNRYPITDMLRRPTDEAANMLKNHCLWLNSRDDNLTSWTSSFLFAIQLAIYRQFGDWGKPSPSSIQIHVLDTRKLPRGTFISAVPLLQTYGICHQKLVHDYCHDEYLSQGNVVVPDGAMAMITYQSLIDDGLHELYPAFAEEEKRNSLRNRVLQFRDAFDDDPKIPTEEQLSIAEAIANRWCSSDGMRPVIMTTLLSLEPRYRKEPAILKAFEVNGWGSYVGNESLDSFNITSSEFVDEHRQFIEMIHDVHADAQRQRQLREAGLATSEVTETFSQMNRRLLHFTRAEQELIEQYHHHIKVRLRLPLILL